MSWFKKMLCGCCLSATAAAAFAQTPDVVDFGTLKRFSFAFLAETPYGPDAATLWGRTIRSIQNTDARFIVHAGDFKSRQEPCSDDLFDERHALLDGSPVPLVYAVGGNEWVACVAAGANGFDPIGRLTRVRDIFQSQPWSMGQQKIAIARQSEIARFRGYPENLRWRAGAVLFVVLNVVGENDDYRAAAGRNGEFEDRVVANRFWLDRAFRMAKTQKLAGVVVIVSGDPEFPRGIRAPDRRSARRDGYYEFKQGLREEVANFKGEVLFLHGGDHGFHEDQPLLDAQGKVIHNLVRVESFSSTPPGNWIHVEINPKNSNVFLVSTMSSPESDEPAAASKSSE